MIDLDAIRARDANSYPTPPIVDESYLQPAQRDRRALLAYVDELLAERAELVSAGYAGKLQRQLDALRSAAGKALTLLEYAEVSDDCQYGTLDTTLVRDSLADLRRLLENKS